jgi:hypothetical protein
VLTTVAVSLALTSLLVLAVVVLARRPEVGVTVRVGEPALDWRYQRSGGEGGTLSELWAQKPLVLIWLRHYG